MTTSPLIRTVQSRFPETVLLVCAVGFAFLLLELIGYQHYREGSQIIGFVSCIVGLALCLLGFLRARAARMTAMVLLGVLALVGLYGVNEHRETRAEDAARFAQRQAQAASPSTRPFKSDIPTLAPLSLSGLSALALLAVVARRDESASAPR